MLILDDASAGAGQYAAYVEQLTKKYDKPHIVHQCHTMELLGLKRMKDDSALEIATLQAAAHNSVIKMRATTQFTGDAIATSLVETLLMPQMREAWARESKSHKKVPNIDTLLTFLAEMAEIRGALRPSNITSKPTKSKPTERPADQVKSRYEKKYEQPYKKETSRYTPQADPVADKEVFATSSSSTSTLCKKDTHPLFGCQVFLSYDLEKHIDYVRKTKLCYNCLSHSHETRACRSTYKCRKCGNNHHMVLHRDSQLTAN